jgi:hypothetical protein
MPDTHLLSPRRRVVRPVERIAPRSSSLAAFRCLQVGYTILPVVAGIDKFTRLLADWDMYLAAPIQRLIPFRGDAFMYGVGAIEILAGLLVAVRPRVGAWVVAAWLGGITLNLLIQRPFLDIALRDIGLIFGACALGLLAREIDARRVFAP